MRRDVSGTGVRIAVALDVAVVVLFAAIGRRNHDEGPRTATLSIENSGSSLDDVTRIAAPFLLGLAVGWLVARAWRRPFDIATGCTIWVVTIALGMVLRRMVFDRGIAFSFVVVATVFTGVLLIGWRLVARRISPRLTHQN
ncbi:MAG TPA: DUF3054 domain-containing protein [Ilumatobacteraceae bacterium]|nr:DUF3054 domain-containing protein [Ilumatobacteraceae bacterium]